MAALIMRLTIERDDALKLFARTAGTAASKSTIPILSNMLLEADASGVLRATATDMDVQVTSSVAAIVDEPGSVTAPARRLLEIAKALPGGAQIGLKHEPTADPRLVVQCARSRYQLPILPATDFPVMAAPKGAASFDLDRDALKRLLDLTRFAASHEETRPLLRGVRLHINASQGETTLRAVATDGHRLACADMPWQDEADFTGITIPTKSADEIRRLLDVAPHRVRLTASESLLKVDADQVEIITRLVDGGYPEYQRVIPRANPNGAAIDAQLLEAALQRSAVLADGKANICRLDFEKGRLVLSARSEDGGHVSEELEIDYTGAPLQVGLNNRYVRDMLGRVKGETLHLAMNGDADPILALDSADQAVRFVIMPARGH